MVFWSRLRQSKLSLRTISDEFRRCYTLNRGPIVSDQHIFSRTSIPVSDNPKFVAQVSQLEIFRQVRSYAAPVQFQKKEEKDDTGTKLNEQITAPSVRLVTDEGHYVISRNEALARAKSLKMDLVLVDKIPNPPVCKIFDYNKEKYLQQTKEKERSKSKSTLKKGACKEVKILAKIKPNDLQIKADTAKRLMASGYRVKVTATEPTSDMDLETLIKRFSALIADVAIEECGPQIEKKQAYIIVRHVKFGPAKKGSGKKASKAATSKNQENGETIEAGQPANSENLSDEDVQTNKSEWDVSDEDDAVFDINDKVNNGLPKNPEPVITVPSPHSSNRSPPVANRYARDPRSVKPPGTPTDANNHNRVPHIPNRGTQPQFNMNNNNRVPHIPNHVNLPQSGMNTSPQRRPNQQVEVPFKQDSSPRSTIPNSPNKSYGIFTGQQQQQGNTPPPLPPREQIIPGVSNRYKRSNPSDSARSQRSTDPRVNREPGVYNSGQGK